MIVTQFYFVYILTNQSGACLYVGVTNSIERRIRQHWTSGANTFCGRYHVTRLVYFEVFRDVRNAIRREKQIKAMRRAKKDALVYRQNPMGEDLGCRMLAMPEAPRRSWIEGKEWRSRVRTGADNRVNGHIPRER